VHSNIMKVQVGDDRIYYPDVLVLCARLPGDTQVIREPSVIVEVTSPSTVRTDRTDKLDSYRRLTAMERGASLLAESNPPRVHLLSRRPR
jgi:Uma2 family endonuclease